MAEQRSRHVPATAPQPRRRLSRPTDAYGYVDQAYGLSSAIGKAPPDYTFDYEGTRPWVWRTETNALRVEEQTPEGDRAMSEQFNTWKDVVRFHFSLFPSAHALSLC